MLICKLKLVIFKEVVHEDDELAHAGSEGDQGFFTSGPESLIKVFQDPVMTHGTQGGHVEGTANRASTATDVAPARQVATVAIIRCHACQGSDGLRIKLSQFRQLGQYGRGDDRAHAGDGLQACGFVGQTGILRDELGEELVALIDLFFQQLLELAVLAHTERIGVMFGAVGFHGASVDELPPALGHICQPLLLDRKSGRWGGLKGGAIVGEDGGIDGIGFGALALGAGEIADSAGFQDADGEVGGLEHTHDGLFVTAGGFTDDVGVGVGTEEFEELGMTFGIIGHGVEVTGQMQLQRKLGNIEADMEDDSVVLTHTCKDTSPGDWQSPCSSNGSSLGQRARAKHARERITHKRMQGENVSTRTAFLWPAGQRKAPAWLAFASLPSRTIKKIQGEKEGMRAGDKVLPASCRKI